MAGRIFPAPSGKPVWRIDAMQHSHLKTNRLEMFGDSLVNRLPSRSRRQRKRAASKKRRATFQARSYDWDDE
jgi:hypothetical protein